MSHSPIDDFEDFLSDGKQLCLLPMSFVIATDVIELSDDLMIYPAKSIDPAYMNIAAYPEHQYAETVRRAVALGQTAIELNPIDAVWFSSASTRVTLNDFFDNTLLALVVEMDWPLFLSPGSHEMHLAIMRGAIENARNRLERNGLNYYRENCKTSWPGRLGHMPKVDYDAALFFTPHDYESYIVAGKV